MAKMTAVQDIQLHYIAGGAIRLADSPVSLYDLHDYLQDFILNTFLNLRIKKVVH